MGFEEKKYVIYSEKYDVQGVIEDWSFSILLHFKYFSKERNIALERPFPFSTAALIEQGLQIMETYIEKLMVGELKERCLMLHYWYVQEVKDGNSSYLVGNGTVSGHEKIMDAVSIHTSKIKQIELDEKAEELLLYTQNSTYHCPLAYCDFKKQDKYAELVPEYELLKEKYEGKSLDPGIEPGKVLLVLSNFVEYYFHSLYYQRNEEKYPLKYSGRAHIGTFQDSYLISTEDYKIDLRYFPHTANIQFYLENTDDKPWYIENIGDITLYAKTSCGLLKLEPGERKEVKMENTEKDEPALPGGDLYPPVMLN